MAKLKIDASVNDSKIDALIKKISVLKERIQELRTVMSTMDAKDPSINIPFEEYKEARVQIKEYMEEIRKLKQEQYDQAKAAKEVINQQIEEIRRLTKAYQEAEEKAARGGNTEGRAPSEQTRTYAEAIDSINRIIGTREENARAIIKELNSLSGLKDEYKKLDEQVKAGNISKEDALRIREKLIVQENEHKQSLSRLNQILRSETKEFLAASTSMDGMSQTLGRMRMVYRSLTEEERNSEFGKNLIVDIQKLDVKLKELDATIGNYQRNVGNYGSSWNGLQNSFQQVVREMPSLAISLNTFFLAISNNLPMLADEIKKANAEYKAFKASIASGNKDVKEVAPVWKQLTKSLLSWQSALVIGISLLSIYGKDIADWVAGLFKGEKAMKDFLSVSQEMALGIKKGMKDVVSSTVELDVLYKATQDHTRSLKERNSAVDELQKKYPSYFGNLSNEAVLTGKAKDAYAQLRGELVANAIARAQLDRMADIANKREDVLLKRRVQYNTYLKAQQKINEASAALEEARQKRAEQQGGDDVWGYQVAKRTKDLKKAQEQAEKEKVAWQGLVDEVQKYDKTLSGMAKNVDVSALINKSVKTDKSARYKDVYKQSQEIQKSSQIIKDSIIKSELGIRQQQIDLMKEGSDKQLAQIRLNYDRRYQEIQKEERELLQKLQDEERKQWEKKNPDYQKKNLQFTPTIISLTPEQRKQFNEEYSLAYQKQENDTQALINKLLAKYRDYDAQRTAIEQQGNADIAALQAKRTDENANEIDRAINVAKDKIKEGIQQINDIQAKEATKDNNFFKLLFGDISSMSFGTLQNLISQAKQLREYLSGNGGAEGITFITPEQLMAIEKSPAELDKLKKALDKLLKGNKSNSWDAIFDGFTKGVAKLKSAKGFKEISEGIQDIGQSASEVSSMLSSVTGSLSSMFEEMGNTAVADALSGMQQVMSAVSNIGEGFAKGGLVGGIAAIVGEAANFIGQAFAANARHKTALKEIMNETIAQQREYNLLLMQQNLEYERATTIFGNDTYGKAANAVKVIKEAISDLKEELYGTEEEKKRQSKDTLLKRFFGVSNPQAELKKAYAGLANIEIKTGHKKTGLFGWGKGKDIYSSILDVYPQLINSNGEFDKSLAETIINTRTMSDESKAALQNLIDLAQQAEDAYDELNDYMTGIFGSLGETMTDALVDAFSNGTDAAKAFSDSVSDMLETLAKQMVYSVTLAPLMEKAQQEMMDVMQNSGLSDEQKFNKWTGILNGLVNDAIDQQELANRLLGEYQQAAKDKGFDIFTSGTSASQDSTKRGFETMSQDTAEELNGRFTALQMAGEEIKGQTQEQTRALNLANATASQILAIHVNVRDIADESRNFIVQSYMELQGIHDDTSAMVKPIKNMANDIAEIKRNTRNT